MEWFCVLHFVSGVYSMFLYDVFLKHWILLKNISAAQCMIDIYIFNLLSIKMCSKCRRAQVFEKAMMILCF